jgi:hypothetical protein
MESSKQVSDPDFALISGSVSNSFELIVKFNWITVCRVQHSK